MLRSLFAAIAIILLTMAPAEAAPVAGLVAALSSWWAGAGLAVKLLIGLAVKVGVGLLEQYRARKAASNQQRGVSLQVQMGDTLPRSYIIGTRATAGTRKYIGSWGSAGKTPNAYLVDVRELSCLPSGAGPTGLQSVRIGDKDVTVLWDQPHADGRGYPVQEYRKNGADYLWIKYLDGTQTASDAYLLDKFGLHATRPWKTTMIGRGCQAVIMTMRRNDTLYKQGLPAALFVPTPMPLYDVRKDSTAGGSGTHRWDNPATWEPSDNLAAMTYNVARGIYYDGRWVHGGRNFASHRLPASSWMAALNEADRNMGEGRKQFRGGLEVTVDTTGLDTLDKLRLGCAGRLAEIGGILKLLVGAPAAAVFAITDESVLVTREQDFAPFPSISEVSNTIRATYPEPAQGWTSKDAPVRTAAALVSRDDGQELAVDVDFDAVSNSAQVQCLTATMIEEAQRWRVHQFVLPPSARVLEPGIDVVSYTSEFNSYGNKKFIVERIARLPGCLWQIVIRELDPADYDPPTIILPPVVGPTGPIDIPDQVMGGFTAVKASVDDGIGTPRRPAIRVACPPDLDDVAAVHVRIRVKQTGAVVYDNAAAAPYPLPNTGGVYSWLLAGTWCVPAGTYLVRGRLIPGSRRETLWSDDIEVTVDNLGIATDDILDEAIKELKIADRAVKRLKIELAAISSELIDNQAIIASKIADAAVTIAKFATGLEPVSIIPGTTVPTTKTTEVIMVNGTIYRWNGTAYVADVDVEQIKGVLKNAQIESLAASKITGQMTNSQIADLAAAKLTGQLVTSQIADAAMTVAKFATGIRPVELVSSLPGAPHVKGRQVHLSTDDKVYRNTGSGWVATVAADDIAGQVQAAQIAALEAVKITGQITGTQITDSAVSTPKLAAASIIASKIAAGAVLAVAIAAGAVTTDKLDALAVTADKLAANSVIAGKVAAGAISASEIASKAIAVRHLFVADFSNLIPDSNLEDIGNWTTGGAAGWTFMAPPNIYFSNGRAVRFLGTYTSSSSAYIAQLFSDYIPVEPDQVYAAGIRFDPNAGSTGTLSYHVHWYDRDKVELSFNNVTPYYDVSQSAAAVDFASRPTAPANAEFARVRLRRGAVENFGDATGTVYAGSMYFRRAASAQLIVDGAIISDKIAANAVTTAKIAANAVTANEIAANAVTAVKISAGAVETAKIAAGAVVADKIASGAVTTAKLDALAVTADKLAANSVIAGKVAAGAISADEIASKAIAVRHLFVGDFSNLIPDSNLQDINNWTTGGAAGWTFMAPPNIYFANGRAVRFLGTYTSSSSAYIAQIFSDYIPVEPDQAYAAGGRIDPNAGATGTMSIHVHWYDRDKNELSVHNVSPLYDVSQSAAAVDFATRPVVPANAEFARFRVRRGALVALGDATGTVYAGSLYLRRAASAELIVDGAIYADKIATNAVTTAKIVAGAITAVELGAGAVTAIKIAAGAVTAEKMNVSSLAAVSANFGNATFSGWAVSVNGKLKLDFDTGGIEVWS